MTSFVVFVCDDTYFVEIPSFDNGTSDNKRLHMQEKLIPNLRREFGLGGGTTEIFIGTKKKLMFALDFTSERRMREFLSKLGKRLEVKHLRHVYNNRYVLKVDYFVVYVCDDTYFVEIPSFDSGTLDNERLHMQEKLIPNLRRELGLGGGTTEIYINTKKVLMFALSAMSVPLAVVTPAPHSDAPFAQEVAPHSGFLARMRAFLSKLRKSLKVKRLRRIRDNRYEEVRLRFT